MMARLEDHYDVPVIVVSLDLGGATKSAAPPDPGVSVRLQMGAEWRFAHTFPASEMRLAPSLAAIRRKAGVGRLTMPRRVIDGLARGLGDWPRSRPVWLRLESPAGHLAAVPWEHVLWPGLGFAILRMPEAGVPAPSTRGAVEIVVCAAAARRGTPYDVAAHVERVVDEIRDVQPAATRIHVFTDDGRERARLRRTRHDIVVHVPPRKIGPPDPGTPGALVENGWLRWMLISLDRSVTIDSVHFVAPGLLTPTSGQILLDTPLCPGLPTAWGPVCAAELITFLTCLGTATVGFTIPSAHAWPAGIRMLAHKTAKELTGPVLIEAPHHHAGDPHALGAMYRILLAGDDAPVPRTPALTTHVLPQRIAAAIEAGSQPSAGARAFEATTTSLASELTLSAEGTDALLDDGEKAPRWLESTQRVLEQLASEVVDPLSRSTQRAASDQGVRDALSFIKDALASDVAHRKHDDQDGSQPW